MLSDMPKVEGNTPRGEEEEEGLKKGQLHKAFAAGRAST